MLRNDMISIRNKKTGETIQVPRSQFKQVAPREQKGFKGITNDISDSLGSAPAALGDMLKSIPDGIKKAGSYALSNNPVSTFANLGAGAVESGAGLLSSPQMLMRYLSEKFPKSIKNDFKDPTFYEGIMDFEKNHGMSARDGEESVRNVGGLLGGGKVLSKLPNMLSRTGAIAAEQGGKGGDPLHAAILAMAGDLLAKSASKGINSAAGMNKPQAKPMLPPDESSGDGGLNQNPQSMQADTQIIPQMQEAADKSTAQQPVETPQVQAVGTPQLQANMLGMPTTPGYMNTISNIPAAATNLGKTLAKATMKIPEIAGKTTASILEKAADMSPKMTQSITQPTFGALASYLKHLSVPPEEMATRKIFGDLKEAQVPIMQERMGAAKRLGLSYLSPAEAALSTFEAEKQGGIGKTSAGSQELYKQGGIRAQDEINASSRFLDEIYNDKELSQEMKNRYEETMNGRVSHEFIQKHSQLPVIASAMNKINTDASYRQIIERELGVPLDKVNPKTFRYWDIMKRVLYDMEDAKTSKIGKPTTQSTEIGNTRKNIVREMDAIKPDDYPVARSISERQHTRNNLENYFDKRPMTLNNWHKYLSSSKNYNNLSEKIKALPDAKQTLADIHLLGGDIIPNEMTIREATKLKRMGMSTPRNKLDALKQELDEKYGKEHDVASVKLMTNPDWLQMFTEQLSNTRKKN